MYRKLCKSILKWKECKNKKKIHKQKENKRDKKWSLGFHNIIVWNSLQKINNKLGVWAHLVVMIVMGIYWINFWKNLIFFAGTQLRYIQGVLNRAYSNVRTQPCILNWGVPKKKNKWDKMTLFKYFAKISMSENFKPRKLCP